MASQSKLTYLEGEVRAKVEAILTRSEMIDPATLASDSMAALLRDLSTALDDFDTRSVDIYNRSL